MERLPIAERDELFLASYARLKPSLARWGDEVLARIRPYLPDSEPLVQGPRIKEDRSLLAKAFYRGVTKVDKNLLTGDGNARILSEIWDKVGIRIVVRDLTAAKMVFAKIGADTSWQGVITKNLQTTLFERPDSFAYASYHVVVRPLGSARYAPDERESLTCEIQIRTLLQHAYAVVSHDLIYKGAFFYDIEARRMMARAQALLEVVDEHFVKLYAMTADLSRTSPRYVHDLVALYRQYNPDFRDDDVDSGVAYRYLTTLKEVSIEKLKSFLLTRHELIRTGLRYNSTVFLFQQPIVLLLAYYAIRHPDYLEEEGDLSVEEFQSLRRGFNQGERE
jgi:putative GTP pyrophosphokinase